MESMLRLGVIALLLGSMTTLGPSDPAAGTVTVAAQQRPPELPRDRVSIPPLPKPGRTVHVPPDGNLQTALDEAHPGDTITLQPRATYRGPFHLRPKQGDGWIVIMSPAPELPAPGRHVTPADLSRMPKLTAASGSVFEVESGAHHYRLVGLEMVPEEGMSLTAVVRIGHDESTLDSIPHHVIVDRCYIHGDPRRGSRRGIALNSRHTVVIDSYLADFKERTEDAQAIGGWNGPGPFRIAGNYLEASGENVMFGGGDPEVQGLVPSDIELVRNHFTKPLRWKKDHPTFEGTEWSVKNLFELKNARRVLVDGNLFEYNWPHAQNGFAILLTVRNQEGGAPWSVVEDVTFTNNLVRHVAAGINILGRDDNYPSQQTRRIAIRNNVFLDVGGRWGGGRLLQLLEGTSGVTFEHNTALHTGGILFGGDRVPHDAFVFQNNVVIHNEHGMIASGTAPGMATLQRYFPGAIVRRNVLVGAPAASYPRDNFFPASLDEIGVRVSKETLSLGVTRRFAGRATDGTDPGADTKAIERALHGLATVRLRASADDDEAKQPQPAGTIPGDGPGPWEFTFWAAAALLGYIYFGYPLLAALRAMMRPRPRLRGRIEPTVSIVVVAHNEEVRIAGRIENLLTLDYPRERMDIIIASDGSTDGTVARARQYAGPGISVRAFANRRGKPAVLNMVVPMLQSEIVLFADARQRFERGTLRALVENFADPSVGAVSGALVLQADDRTAAAGRGTAFYWRYEKFIRATEARSDSTVGATGAIYAIRRSLFEPIPDDTLLDDVLIPLRIVRKGFRVLFEPAARAFDSVSRTAGQELVRKIRTNAGTFQLFARERWVFNPRQNRLWFETISHKALRLALPFLHVTLLVATVALAGGAVYRWALAAQLAFYAAAVIGYFQQQSPRRSVVFSVPCAICLLSWASLVGLARFITNRQQVTWERVAAPTETV